MELRGLIGYRTCESILDRKIIEPYGGETRGHIVQIALDGVVYRFVKRVLYPDSWLSAIQPLGVVDLMRHRDDATTFDPPRMVDIRWRETSLEEDAIYAFDETRNVVLFEVGTEVDGDGDLMFVWEYKGPDGYTPTWLEAIDPDPPVEIMPKRKHTGDRTRKRTPTGRMAY